MPVFERHQTLGDVSPYFNFLILPDAEQKDAIEHMTYLAELWSAVLQFNHALNLFDFCERKRPDEYGWKLIAARDGAWSIYNFGSIMQYFRAGFGTIPTLSRMIEHDSLRTAQKLFDSSFPDFPLIRHALAHVPESTMNQEKRDKNYYKGSFTSDGMIVEGDQTLIMIKNSLKGRKYQTTFNGRLLSYELSEETLKKLIQAKDIFFSGFKQVEKISVKTPNWKPGAQS
ncbi:MAG: hypothetical protein ACK4UO_07825 [Pseudolabrys sp.]